jgi:hypothetical protein
MKARRCAVATFSALPPPTQECFAAVRALIRWTVSVEAFVEASEGVETAALLESWRSPKPSSSDLPQGVLAWPASRGLHKIPMAALHSTGKPGSWA